jgi:hypothetical protein
MKDPFSALPRLKGPALLDPSQKISSGSALDSLSSLRAHSTSDWERIFGLGFDPGLTKEEVDAISRIAVKPAAYADGFRLLPRQAWSYAVLRETNGALFVPVGVGDGKTFLGLLAAAFYFETGNRKLIYFLQPNGWEQLVNRDIPEAQEKLQLGRLPFQYLGNRTKAQRASIAHSNAAGCYLMPYSLLSTKDATEILYAIKPTAIIADEGHNLCGRGSARTKRLFTYVREAKPFFAPMSGTMCRKSLMDYHHLLVAALGLKAPIPLNPSDAMDWATVLDAGCDPTAGGISRMAPLMSWAQKQDATAYGYSNDLQTSYRRVRMSYQLRLRSAPGVVSTDPDTDIGTSLVIANRPVSTEGASGYAELQRLIKQVATQYITPNGDDINHAIHTYKWLRELSCGFWYKLDWPENAEREALERSKLHLAASNVFNRDLRFWLDEHAKPHLDTPMLVGASLARYGARDVGERLWKSWKAREECDFPGRLERVRSEVRVCDFKVRQAVEWAREYQHGLIWYEYQEAGKWIMDALREADIPALHCPAGRVHDAAIAKSHNQLVVAGIDAHGTGKNLQFHTNQYCFQFPRRAETAEQLLGRTHRYGQQADELIVYTNNTTEHDHMCFSAMLIDSLFVVQTQGIRRKVVFATYDPMPEITPPEVLMERGFHDIRQLSEQGRKQLATLFRKAS